jgi:Ca-activated chloride channel family protein
MNFEHANYLPFIAGAIAALLVTVLYLERKFFKIVKLYWFYKRSLFSYISSILFLAGMIALLVSLLDFRGPEERIKGGVPTDRTIILIDTSASMLAEDVKPSRLQKASLIAKHFARKAAGHQLSIVAFAEIQKKIVPFTNDLDLIDARLDSIKNLRNQNGSSALSAAIQESIQYFKETGETRGNILILTDGEETAESINLNIPKEIYIALVGVGTSQGGRIPLDDGRGFRFGYKKSQGKDVITKLNEDFFKQITADISTAQYWLANTYSLPSDEILDFFKGQKANGEKQQDMVIKPVMMEWIVIPAIVLLILSYAFKAMKVFSLGLLLLILPLHAQEAEEPELSPEIQQKLELLQQGELNQLEKIKLADELQKAGAKNEALALYEENLPRKKIDPNVPAEAYLNYGTALLEKGEAQKGLQIYDALTNQLDAKTDQGKKINGMIEKNIVNYFKVQEQKQQQKKKQDQENKDNQDKNQKNQQGSGNSQDQKNQSQSGNSQQKDPKEGEQPQKDKKDKGDKGEEEKKDKSEENQDKDQNKEQQDKNQEGEKKKLPPQKIPAKLKQLMSDDRQLQLKIIEQNTRDMNRRKSRQNKDW